MARRKGWEDLSESYRKRLIKGGISRTDYESGVSLGKARGHATPIGIGEKSYANLRALARTVHWYPDETPESVVDDALRLGRDARWIRERIETRKADTVAYRHGNKVPGKTHWDRRSVVVNNSWYWYH